MAGWSLWPPLEGEGTGVDRWPLRKFPLLVDSERNIVECSIIIEYLQFAHPGPVRLLARRSGPPRTSDSFFGDSPLPTSTDIPRCPHNPEMPIKSASGDLRHNR